MQFSPQRHDADRPPGHRAGLSRQCAGSDTVMILGLVTKPPFNHRASRNQRLPGAEARRWASPLRLVNRLAPPPHSLEKWGFKPETDVPILQMEVSRPSWPECNRRGSLAGHFHCPHWREPNKMVSANWRTWRIWFLTTRWPELLHDARFSGRTRTRSGGLSKRSRR